MNQCIIQDHFNNGVYLNPFTENLNFKEVLDVYLTVLLENNLVHLPSRGKRIYSLDLLAMFTINEQQFGTQRTRKTIQKCMINRKVPFGSQNNVSTTTTTFLRIP